MEMEPQFIVSSKRLEQRIEPATHDLQGQHADHCTPILSCSKITPEKRLYSNYYEMLNFQSTLIF